MGTGSGGFGPADLHGDASGLARPWVDVLARRLTMARAAGVGARDVGEPRRWREALVFIVLAVLIWPFIAVGVVAGWGFVVWMYYLFTGPPGPV
jgi:nitrate reductase NapE